jgi:hypothetical protein
VYAQEAVKGTTQQGSHVCCVVQFQAAELLSLGQEISLVGLNIFSRFFNVPANMDAAIHFIVDHMTDDEEHEWWA